MDHVDRIFANRVSHLLEKFEERADGKLVFRCPYCGDSTTNPNKKTAAVVSNDDGSVFKCLRCETVKSFGNFLKDVDVGVHRQWVTEKWRMKDRRRDEPKPETYSGPKIQSMDSFLTSVPAFESKMIKEESSNFDDLERMELLPSSHPARKYLERRLVKPYGLYWTDDFWSWAKARGKLESKYADLEGRIIFPLIVRGIEIGAQGRSISDNQKKLRYVTVSWDKRTLPCYGFDDANFDEDVFLTEGVFDAIASGNGIAVLRSDLRGFAEENEFPKDKVVLVYDNEPGSPIIVKQVERAVAEGWRIGVWRGSQSEVGKDLSEHVCAGGTVNSAIEACSGLKAKLKLASWKGATY